MFGTVFDIEGDSLTPTKLHVLAATNSDTDEPRHTTSYDAMKEFTENTSVFVGHNIARFDIPVLERLLGCKVKEDALIIDTLALSWYLYPTRHKDLWPEGGKKGHGLDGWGREFGIKKPEIENWEDLPIEEYMNRCVEDVKITRKLWQKEYQYLLALYGNHDDVVRFLKYIAFKMDCAREQEESRWKLDIDRCRNSIEKLESIHKNKVDELRHAMPKVEITRTVKRPKLTHKGNGELSEAGKRWYKLLEGRGLPSEYGGEIQVVTGYDEPNPSSHEQIKKWLYSLGWVPRTFKENKKGEEIPQINKLKQDGGGVCESIQELYEVEPRLEALDSIYVIQHRLGILRGFLSAVSDDGYVKASIQGLTNTLRFKHAEVVNLPKVDTPYGEDVRGCLIAPDGYELCGSDMSSLEDRLKQHFCFKYDPDYVMEMMTPDFDPHLDLALSAGALTKEQVQEYKSGTVKKEIKSLRGIFKNGNYACQYGAGAPKLAKTAGISIDRAREVHEAYWSRNWSIKAVAQSCKVRKVNGQDWLYNPISRFWYSLRSDKDKFSTLVQGSGVFCFDTWLAFIRKDRPQLTGQFHDEIILCVKKGYREEVTKFLRSCIDKTNDLLNLNRELNIGIDFGDNYAAIH